MSDKDEYRGFIGSWGCPWMVVYSGSRRCLAIAQVRDFQQDEWDLASTHTFLAEYDARDYMIELAERHGLRYEGQKAYLD